MIPFRTREITALILVPMVLVIADIIATRTALKFLLLPPFGALTYLVFVNPGNIELNIRRVIICPSATALLAWAVANTLGYNTVSVALTTIATMGLMFVLDSRMVVPPLALELLTLLLHDQIKGQFGYIISVVVFTAAIYLLYRLWARLVREPAREQAEVMTP